MIVSLLRERRPGELRALLLPDDAARLARSGAPVRQITTGTTCHLEAAMIQAGLEGWEPERLDFLFIENVGNLVCPSAFDLGEAHKIVILSVPEGEDKPLKYPHMFQAAAVMILNKIDLLPHVDFDMSRAVANALEVNPNITALRLSARTGEGLEAWYGWLRREAAAAREAAFA